MLESVAAIVSLFAGAMLGVLFDRVYTKIERSMRLRRLSLVIPLSDRNQNSEIFVRPSLEISQGGTGGGSKRAYTHAAEVIALQHLSSALHETPAKLRFRYDEKADDPFADWIILGMSRRNSLITDALFDRIKARSGIEVVKGTGSHQYIKINDEKEFRCSHVHDEEFESKVEKDYGIIVRIHGDNGNCLLLCGGIHMFGTQGALEVAISESFIRHVHQSCAKEFVQVVEVPVLKDGISINRDGLRWKDLPFRPLA